MTAATLPGVLTADCAPVLLADAEAGVIGAAHAGWKGARAGVTDRAIAAKFGPDTARFFKPGREGHAQFDLEGYVSARLTAAGIATVERLNLDTYADESRFYSYRRATHRGEADYGRQISVIGLGKRASMGEF